MNIGSHIFWISMMGLAILIPVLFIVFAAIWSSRFRNQHSYDRWFVSNLENSALENSAGAGYELGSSNSLLNDSKLGAVCPLTQGSFIDDPAFNNCISTI